MTVPPPAAPGYGRGKVILLGEHAVVYGHPALAGAMDRGVAVVARRAEHPRIRVSAWGMDVLITDEHPAARAVRGIAIALGADELTWTLDIDAQVPAACGLGSSAALAVAVARVIASVLGRAVTPSAIVAAANAAEREFHHNPSGVDVALALHGGFGLYQKEHGFVPVSAPPLSLAIGLSGQSRSTAQMVERVARATREDPQDPRLVALGEHATLGALELTRGELTNLGARLDRAQELLVDLGVSTPPLDELVTIARATGALGAKLTGAGGGGAVIALAPGREQDIVGAWRAAGYEAMQACVG